MSIESVSVFFWVVIHWRRSRSKHPRCKLEQTFRKDVYRRCPESISSRGSDPNCSDPWRRILLFLPKFLDGGFTPLSSLLGIHVWYGPKLFEVVHDQPSSIYQFLREYQQQIFDQHQDDDDEEEEEEEGVENQRRNTRTKNKKTRGKQEEHMVENKNQRKRKQTQQRKII